VDVAGVHPIPSTSTAPDPDAVFVNAAKDGDSTAFKKLIDKYYSRIFHLAQNMTRNREDAEDIVQDSFLKVFLHLDSFHGDSRFYTWLVRIAVNEGRMKLRQRRRDQFSIDEQLESNGDLIHKEIEDWGLDPEQRYANQELQRILIQAISQLELGLRIVFQLREVEQLSCEETAQVLGISISAVKSRLWRARLKLRQMLKEHLRQSDSHFVDNSRVREGEVPSAHYLVHSESPLTGGAEGAIKY
jgi:RNA polymerase sigma-70 factor (ECF subfamily)